MNALTPCPGCRRHVRQSETSCPFCSVELDLSVADPVLPRTRLGRAALFAFGATLAASVSTTACGSDDDGGGSGGSGGSGATSSGGSGGSGGSAGSATGGTAGSGSGGVAGNAAGGSAGFAAEYGGPPFDGGAGFSADYGTPPMDGG